MHLAGLANDSYISAGKPVKAPALIPVHHQSSPVCINEVFMVDGKAYGVTCVSFGTPHGVVLVDDLDKIEVARLGAALGTHSRFPQGASIVFVQVLNPERIKARLWQRGRGEIGFTGEAVCAAMTAAKMLQKIEREADVFMGGKKFHVKWDSLDDSVSFAQAG